LSVAAAADAVANMIKEHAASADIFSLGNNNLRQINPVGGASL
jgi:hypothetical protein